MRAAVYRQGELVVDEVPDPVPDTGQVLVRTRLCGICGSDLHFVHDGPHVSCMFQRVGSPFPMDTRRDIVLGHEFCGEVVERTPGGLAPGTPVCSVPFAVAHGRAHFLGYSADQPGGFGQYLALNEANLLPIPNGLSLDHAALTEPMAVGWHGVRRAGVGPRDVALVVGCGPIGLAVVAGLKVAGVHAVVAADFNAERRAVALAMGADLAIDPAERSPYAAWAELALPPGYDPGGVEAALGIGAGPRPSVIFECVGLPGMVQQALTAALPRTRIVVLGVCLGTDTIEPLFALTREVDLRFSIFYDGAEYAQTLRHLAEGLIDVSPMVSRTVPLGGVRGALDALAAGASDTKILVDPWG